MDQQFNGSNRSLIFGLVGAGGFAREVMPIVVDYLTLRYSETRSFAFYFVESEVSKAVVNSVPCISVDEFFSLPCEDRRFNIAVADSKIRQRIADDFVTRGAQPMSLQAMSAEVYDTNTIGEGAILCGHTMVTSNATIGRFFQSNIYSYVAHDCVIGDFVTFAPSVCCNGNVHIQDHAYIGTGAIIKQGTSSKPLVIGEGATVGMGAVVTKNVEPFTTVVGNPARPHTKAQA